MTELGASIRSLNPIVGRLIVILVCNRQECCHWVLILGNVLLLNESNTHGFLVRLLCEHGNLKITSFSKVGGRHKVLQHAVLMCCENLNPITADTLHMGKGRRSLESWASMTLNSPVYVKYWVDMAGIIHRHMR